MSPKVRISRFPNKFCFVGNWNGVQSEGGFGNEFGVGGSKHLLPAKPWGDALLLLVETGDDLEPWESIA